MASLSASHSAIPRVPTPILTTDAVREWAGSGAGLRGDSLGWTRFSWQLKGVPSTHAVSSGGDMIRFATREESEDVLRVILLSLSMDSSWNDSFPVVQEYIKTAADRLFESEDPLCLVIPKGNRIIAASLLDPQMESRNNLVSGPAVLMEYRNRGIGAMLLHASLIALRERGLSLVTGATRIKTVASRHVYPKFGAVSELFPFSALIESGKESKA